MTWTGKEPLSSYTHRIHTTSWRTFAISSAIRAMAALLAIPSLGGAGHLVSGVSGLLLLMAVHHAIYAWRAKSIAHRPERPEIRTAWSLHVGPHYIMATDTIGRRERTWARIQRVTIEEIQGMGPYRYTGIHVKYTESSRPGTAQRINQQPVPVGWPYPRRYFFKESFKSQRGRFPICVLGPMTDEQRRELTDALAGYGGQRWEAPAPALADELIGATPAAVRELGVEERRRPGE